MDRIEIPISDWQIKPHDLWNNQWLLLTSGNFLNNDFNAMTVGWGSFGTMWNRPFAMIAVRDHRYTFQFTEKHESFTLSAFSPAYQKSLNLLGTKSGRDLDKIKEANITPIASKTVAAPGFEEAELIVECKKMYWQNLEPENFLTRQIHLMYPQKDYHRLYFGEILAVFGADKYKA